jgi:hypothetical protein
MEVVLRLRDLHKINERYPYRQVFEMECLTRNLPRWGKDPLICYKLKSKGAAPRQLPGRGAL